MLRLYLCLLITVTFSTPTPANTSYRSAVGGASEACLQLLQLSLVRLDFMRGLRHQRLSVQTLVSLSLRQKPVLARFGCGQQPAVRSSAELHQQRIFLQSGPGTIVMFNGVSEQANCGILLSTVRQQSSDGIPRLHINSRERRRFDLVSGIIALGGLRRIKAGLKQITPR